MSFVNNQLSFDVLNTNNVQTIGIMDTSLYASGAAGYTLQILVPGYRKPVELSYYKNAVTILNSNTLKLSNVSSAEYYIDLPDGLYTAKISICPHEDNWYEKSWYRIAALECKYYKAFLNLELNICTNCYNKHKKEKLDLIWTYIQGIQANVTTGNYKMATELYNTALKLVDKIINCEDCHAIN